MLSLISPAKTFVSNKQTYNFSKPFFEEKSNILIKNLKQLSTNDIKKLMHLSDKLAELNYTRFQQWHETKEEVHAIFAFMGDVYKSLEIEKFAKDDINYLQDNLMILSGLYGLLKPLDKIQPYRLEMGTSFQVLEYKNLYNFWQKELTSYLNKVNHATIINLASQEYSKAIDKKNLKKQFITIDFKEYKNDKLKTIGIYAKKARGKMAQFIALNKIQTIEDIKSFEENNYSFNQSLSTQDTLVFTAPR